MPTRNITCLNCGCAGMLDVHHHANDVVPNNQLFKHVGHNPYSCDLHYQCPACKIVLLVDPIAALGKIPLEGFPAGHKDLFSSQCNNRSVGLADFHGFSQGDYLRATIY